MKNTIHYLILLLCFSWNVLLAETKPLFEISSNSTTKMNTASEIVDGTFLKLNSETLNDLFKGNEETIQISIPRYSKSNLEITLYKKQILSDQFYASTLTQSEGRSTFQDFSPGHFYQNTTNGNFAAISLFENEINGVISVDGENYSLGPLKDPTKINNTNYIFKKDNNSPVKQCDTETSEEIIFSNDLITISEKTMADRIVYVYMEVDYYIYSYYSSNITITNNYVTSAFNVVNAIYDQEEIDLRISEISVWTEIPPYNQSTSLDLLSDFRSNRECVNGELAHYVTKTLIGGRAVIGGVCKTNGFGVTGLGIATINNFPNFTYGPDVLAHELGHNLGSPHTHNCSWSNGVLDNCAAPEGNCGPTDNPIPPSIMSYCNSTSATFTYGLGVEPGNRIRNHIDEANCNDQIQYINIFENDFYGCPDGDVTLDGTIPNCQNCTYIWNDGFSGAIREVFKGGQTDYCLQVTDANGNIFADHVRVNSYPLEAEFAILNPTGCEVGTVTIIPTGGTGTYTYEWSDGNISNFKTDLAVGSYEVTISDGICDLIQTIDLTQAPSIETNKTFGGDDNDELNKILQTNDGKILLTGTGRGNGGDLGFTNGNQDFWVIKTELDGTIIWKKTYGGALPDKLNSAINTPDGGFLLVGSTDSDNGDIQNKIGGPYVSDGWIIKIDANGNLLWSKTYGSTDGDELQDIIQTIDGNYVVVGESRGADTDIPNNNGNSDYWVLKIDDQGNILWSKTHGGNDSDWDAKITEATNGNLYLTGRTYSDDIPNYHGSVDIALYGLEPNGNEIWKSAYGGTGLENATNITATEDGNLVIGATTVSDDGDVGIQHSGNSAWVFKINTAGNILWKRLFASSKSGGFEDIITTNDGNLLLTGFANNYPFVNRYSGDLLVMNLDANNGNVMWSDSYGGNGQETGLTLLEFNNGDYFVGGTAYSQNGDVGPIVGGSDYWLLRLKLGGGAPAFTIDASSLSIENGPVTLTSNPPISNPIWSTGASTQSITINTPGTYSLTGGTDGCTATQSITISGGNCTDNDNDGYCVENDCDDNNPNLPTTIGSSCDDNDPNTTNDIIQSDGCTCQGTPVAGVCNVSITSSNGGVTITGLTGAENAKLFDASISTIWGCNPWSGTTCSNNEIVTGLVVGDTYFLSVQSDNCDEWIPIVIQGGGPTATCSDGIQNQGETGIDCGGPCTPCPVGPTCNDGIQNQGETGIDCGGPCAPCPTVGCNVSVSSSNGMVTITGLTSAENAKLFDTNIDGVWGCNPWNGTPCSNSETVTGLVTGATYFLSVQSDECDEWIPVTVQGGGPTPTCSDGIQNQGETGIDCGGPCAPCPITPTCTDGIQNQGETGTDCGGPCAPCPTGGCNVSVSSANGVVTVIGLTSAENAKLFDANVDAVWGCNPWSGTSCSNSETISGLTAGATYFLSVQSDECDEWIPVTVQGGGGFTFDCDLNIDPEQLTVSGTGDPSGNVVDWSPPAASTNCPGGVTVTQISGQASGSFLTAWVDHIVVYEITDQCGNSEICYNEIFIEGAYGGISCTQDITVNATSNLGAIVNYDLPQISQGTCIIGEPDLISGNHTASGMVFPIGTTTIEFVSFAAGSNTYCQTSRYCSFDITVTNGCPDSDDDGICDEDDCEPNNPSLPTPPGTPCNDMNFNTTNDIIQADGCTCQGTPNNPNLSDLNIINFNSIEGMPGAVVYFPFTLRNIGVGTAVGDYQINTYISTDSSLSSDDILEGSITTGNTIVGSEEVIGAITVPTSLATGLYTFFIVVDDNNDIDEIDETNNITQALLNVIGGGNGCNIPTPSGFTALGEFGNSKYFRSNASKNFASASAEATSLGGHIVSITSQAENDFIQSNLDGNIVLIGLNDLASEGNLMWENGETVGYNNLVTNNNAVDDVGVMNFWAGTWDLNEYFVERPYILEVPCNASPRLAPIVTNKTLTIHNVFPNPTKGEIFVQLESTNDVSIQMSISNFIGQTIEQKEIDLETGLNTISVDLLNHSNGIYHLNFNTKDQVITKKIVKFN